MVTSGHVTYVQAASQLQDSVCDAHGGSQVGCFILPPALHCRTHGALAVMDLISVSRASSLPGAASATSEEAAQIP
jgi:hypothetical protein